MQTSSVQSILIFYMISSIIYMLGCSLVAALGAVGLVRAATAQRKQLLPEAGLNGRIKTISHLAVISIMIVQLTKEIAMWITRLIWRATGGGGFISFLAWIDTCIEIFSQYLVFAFVTYLTLELVQKCIHQGVVPAAVISGRVKTIVLVAGAFVATHGLFLLACVIPLLIVSLVFHLSLDKGYFPRDDATVVYVYVYWRQIFNALMFVLSVVCLVSTTLVLGNMLLRRLKAFALSGSGASDPVASPENEGIDVNYDSKLTLEERLVRSSTDSLMKAVCYLAALLLCLMLSQFFSIYELFNNQTISSLDADISNFAFTKLAWLVIMCAVLLLLRPAPRLTKLIQENLDRMSQFKTPQLTMANEGEDENDML